MATLISGRRSWSLVASMLLWASTSAAQDSGWRQLANGHRFRSVGVEDSRGIAVALALPWPTDLDAGRARVLACAEARRRSAAADAAAPSAMHTQVEVGYGFTSFCIAVDSEQRDLPEAWLAALVQPTSGLVGDELRDLLLRDLAIAALAADDSDWLYPGDRLSGAARRAAFAGTAFGTGLLGDARAIASCTDAEFGERLLAAPTGPVFVAALGEPTALAAFEAAVATLPAPLQAVPSAAFTAPVAAIDLALPPVVEAHPRVDAGFAAIALQTTPLERGGLVELVAVEVLRRRARSRFSEYRGAEPLARAPYVQTNLLGGDPLVVLHRRAPTPDFLDPAIHRAPPAQFVEQPHRELVELLQHCEHTAVRPEEAQAALRIVAAELALPPYPDPLSGAMRRLPQAMLAPARVLCLLGRAGLADETVRSGLAADATGISSALRALVGRACWHGGLVPIPPKNLGG